MNNYQSSRKKNLIQMGTMFALLTAALVYFLGLHNMDLTVPMNYIKPNTGELLTRAKWICTTGWGGVCESLGAPFGASLLDVPGIFLQLIETGVLKGLYAITGSVAVALNVQIIVNFYVLALVSFIVMKQLGFKGYSCVAGSLTFALSTYVFMATMNSLGMYACYSVPLAVLVAMWVYGDEEFFRLKKGFFKNKKNIAALVIILLASGSGMGYYGFMTGCIILTAGVSATLKGKGREHIKTGLVLTGGLLILGIIGSLPNLIGGSVFHESGSAVAEADFGGLKLIQLFLPMNFNTIDIIGVILGVYYKYACVFNEGIASFLGIVGIIGFVVLILTLFAGVFQIKKDHRLSVLAESNMVLLLVCQTGGLGSLLVWLMGGGLTEWHRGSIFIVYMAVLAFCICAEWLLERCRAWRKNIVAVVFTVLVGFGIINQFPQFPLSYAGFYGEQRAAYEAEKTFIKELEGMLPDNAMIYQPSLTGMYNPTELNGKRDASMDVSWVYNNRSVGYYHSDKLLWNIDAYQGYEADEFRAKANECDMAQLVELLREQGFEGIFIDRSNYEGQDYLLGERNYIEMELERITGNSFVVSANGVLEYISLR